MTFHLVAWLVLEREGRVLLARRAAGRLGAGLWGLPGGHVEAGETLAQAAAREAEEEVGVTLDPAELHPLGVTRYASPEAEGLDVFFLARRFAGEPQPRAECDALSWAAPADLPPDTLPWLPRALRQHLLEGRWLDEQLEPPPGGP